MRRLSLWLAVAILGACAHAPPTPPPAPMAPPTPVDVITRDEIETITGATAFDAVAKLRPRYLLKPPSSDGHDVSLIVYVNSVLVGGVSALRDVPLATVKRIEYFDGPHATSRWGPGHEQGALLVITERSG